MNYNKLWQECRSGDDESRCFREVHPNSINAETMRVVAEGYAARQAAKELEELEKHVEGVKKTIEASAQRGEFSLTVYPSFYVEPDLDREVRMGGAVAEKLEELGFEVAVEIKDVEHKHTFRKELCLKVSW